MGWYSRIQQEKMYGRLPVISHLWAKCVKLFLRKITIPKPFLLFFCSVKVVKGLRVEMMCCESKERILNFARPYA